MPSSKSNSNSKNENFRRGFKAEAERIAEKCRNELGLKNHEPLSSFVLAEHLGLKVITPSEIKGISNEILNELVVGIGRSSWSAITIGHETPILIIHNNSHAPTRIESNIMHELAHVLLNHQMHELDNSLGIPLRKFDPVQEAEAEWLGGCLQIPKCALVKHYVYSKKTHQEIGVLYNASIAMVNYRISVSGIDAMKNRVFGKNK